MNPVLKRVLTGVSIGVVVIGCMLFLPPKVLEVICAVLFFLALSELFLLVLRKLDDDFQQSVCAFLVFASFLALMFMVLPQYAAEFGNVMLFYIVAIVKFSDVGGFAFGLSSAKLLKGGNHKLCPTISPGKSWEGLLGSVVFSCAVSCAFVPLTKFGVPKALAFGLVAALVGTAGDLVESKFKRWVGVKDSSTLKITNGMGGILDMVDSLLFAPAVLLPSGGF